MCAALLPKPLSSRMLYTLTSGPCTLGWGSQEVVVFCVLSGPEEPEEQWAAVKFALLSFPCGYPDCHTEEMFCVWVQSIMVMQEDRCLRLPGPRLAPGTSISLN